MTYAQSSTTCTATETNSSGSLSEAIPHLKYSGIQSLSRAEVIVTEKIDGTNAVVYVHEDGRVLAGSRNRWITLDNENLGFARYVEDHTEEFREMGPGYHYGEFIGCGIQRRYNNIPKEFVSFEHWRADLRFRTVPILYTGLWSQTAMTVILQELKSGGSVLVPGFTDPEGIVVQFQGNKARHIAFKMFCVEV
ncbi:hypothetical protein D4R42_02075 [bacterium]|nr:MAG: hypothetical protein D4R42_02075 [bacterium]